VVGAAPLGATVVALPAGTGCAAGCASANGENQIKPPTTSSSTMTRANVRTGTLVFDIERRRYWGP
jgi:hypothetical protein